MDIIFWVCVKIMQILSNILGITYQELNVLIFVIIHPLITIIFILLFIRYKKLYITLKKKNYELQTYIQRR